MKIILVIPTKDRPKDIQNLFESLEVQTRKPDHIIVVDGSAEPIAPVLSRFEDKLPIEVIRCVPPSLPKQRNVGIKALPQDSDWVGFLDDDLVLDNEALEQLEKTILAQKTFKLKGVGLSIQNQPNPKLRLLLKAFLMSTQPGRVTMAGYPTAIPCVEQDIRTDWLYGGATFWSADVFKKFQFDEWFFGTGYMEDVDFSFRVSREYELMVAAKAKCFHYHHQIPVTKETSIGEWQLTSWWYFVSKHHQFHIAFVMWGMFGLVVKNLLAFAFYRTKPYWNRHRGHMRGLRRIFMGQALTLKGFSK